MDPLDNARTLIGDAAAKHTFSLSTGADFGQYRVLSLLGRGGMGEVYAVEHRVLRRRYALKLLPPEFAGQPGAVARFETEARVMANLDHPHIVRVDDFGETDGRFWLRMELASGTQMAGRTCTSLEDYAASSGGRITSAEVLAMLQQVLAGLSHAHKRGAVHRDMKPSNILLFSKDDELILKISDFGLAQLIGAEWIRSRVDASVRLSMRQPGQETINNAATMGTEEGSSTRSLIGTYEYMSPEQKRGEEATAQSDLYAVGLMAFKLLTGRNPGAKPPSRIVAGLDPAWDDVLIMALEEDPAERHADATAFLAALPKAAAAPDGTPAKGRPSAPSVSPRATSPRETPAASTASSDEHQGPTENQAWTIEDLAMSFLPVAAGEFQMGTEEGEDDEKPVHRVKILRAFWIGKTEVTQKQWLALMGDNPSYFEGDDHPVENVDWDKCVVFCQKLTKRERRAESLPTGYEFRLPTEAEWEYAARGGAKSRGFAYSGSNSLEDVAWYESNSEGQTHPVGQKIANELGLHDMSGNVYEWCLDWYGDYEEGTVSDPKNDSTDSDRVFRGGSWYDEASYCRSAYRGSGPPEAEAYLGFRVVLVPVP
ncbi:MAG: bifunctional serine/threonine-protein kinase/formylglycine-generating enzyme family protein [Kiritimatiellia bacterium]